MTKIRWKIVLLCMLGNTLCWLDRSALGVALPYMRTELSLTRTQEGFVLSAVTLLVVPALLVSGVLADRMGARRLATAATGLWSLFFALTCAIHSVVGLIGLRIAFGVSEAAAYPSWVKATSTWFPRSERGRAVAIYDSGTRIGSILAFPVAAGLIALVGWRWSFLALGLLGAVWIPVWLSIYRDDPSIHAKVNAQELAHIAPSVEDGAKGSVKVPWLDLLLRRGTWALVLLNFFSACQAWFYLAWIPTYLVDVRHFNLAALGVLGPLPGVVGLICGLLGGIVNDVMIRRGFTANFTRKLCIVIGMLLSSVCALAPFASSTLWVLILLAIAQGGLGFAAVTLFVLAFDLSPVPERTSSLSAIQICGTIAGAGAFPLLVGYILDKTAGSFTWPLALSGGTSVLAALTCLFILPRIQPMALRIPRDRSLAASA